MGSEQQKKRSENNSKLDQGTTYQGSKGTTAQHPGTPSLPTGVRNQRCQDTVDGITGTVGEKNVVGIDGSDAAVPLLNEMGDILS